MNEREAIVALIDSTLRSLRVKAGLYHDDPKMHHGMQGSITALEELRNMIDRGDHLKGNRDER